MEAQCAVQGISSAAKRLRPTSETSLLLGLSINIERNVGEERQLPRYHRTLPDAQLRRKLKDLHVFSFRGL